MTTLGKLYFVCIICLLSYPLTAQDKIYNKKTGLAVKTDILAIPMTDLFSGDLYQSYSLSLEKLLGNKQSFQLSGYYSYFNNSPHGHEVFRGFQIIPEYRFYLNKKNCQKGIYCGIYTGFINEHYYIPNVDYNHKFRFIELGALSGYQTYLFKHFIVDFLIGFGAKKTISKKIINSDGLTPSNQRPYYLDARLSLNIGYVFY